MLKTLPPAYAKQAEAMQWVIDHRHCILAMGMGTGKSRALVDAWKKLNPRVTLIFAPKAVIEQGHWTSEFQKWGSDVTVCELLKGSMAKRLERAQEASTKQVVLTVNYEALQNKTWVAWLRKSPPDLVVYDEIQRLKGYRGKRSNGAAKVQPHVKRIVGLTGTLLPHSPLDGFGIFRAVDPDIFGWSYTRYRARYAVMGGSGILAGKLVLGFQRKEELAELMSKITIRATREEMLDLPDATHITVPVTLSPDGKRAYQTMSAAFIAEIGDGLVTASNGLVKLLRLQQITTGAMRTDQGDRVQVDTAKRTALLELLSDTDEPVVVFGRFSEDMTSVAWCCDQLDELHQEVSGAQNDLAAWRAGEGRVLGLQISAGAEGIDLTRAAICIFLSTGFSLGQFEQALARVHRPGQTRSVVYYYLVAKGTIDTHVAKSLREKKDAVMAVLELMGKGGAE